MLWWFAETTLIAGGLAGVAEALGRVRSIGPTARHLLWLVVLIKLMVPPVIPSPWPLPIPTDCPAAWWPAAAEPTPADMSEHPEAVALDVAPDEALPRLEAEPEAAVPSPRVVLAGTGGSAAGARPAIARLELEAWQSTAEPRGWAWTLPDAVTLRRWTLWGWALGTIGLGLVQTVRIVRFRRRLRDAVPAPSWLVEEAEAVGARLGVQTPEVLAVPGLGTPMLWCLGRPELLLPCHLIKSLEASRWRGIFAHELAHLGRGDHWVGRLELAAGLVWWWNPLYWLARRRIDAEAELACDAWVVWALPDDRLTYAEVLFQICSGFSQAVSPAPALGVAGSGRFFERRLTMILHDRTPCRISPLILLAAGILAILALPSWTLTTPPALAAPVEAAAIGSPVLPGGQAASEADEADGDADDETDDDDDRDAQASRKKSADRRDGDTHKSRSGKVDVDVDVAGIEKLVESALGPDFEKKMEEWGEKFGKEMEERFGENSEFAKKMEAFGKEMEERFGENSEFAKKMEAFGKEMEKKFGPGSDFEKKMKVMGEEMEKKFGPGSDFEKKIKAKADAAATKARARADEKRKEKQAGEKGHDGDLGRAERVRALEAKIRELAAELKALRAAEREEDDEK